MRYSLKAAARSIGTDDRPVSTEAVRRKVLQFDVAERDEMGRLAVPEWVVEIFRHNWRLTGYLGKYLPKKSPEDAAA
jgi:hypothetical protein